MESECAKKKKKRENNHTGDVNVSVTTNHAVSSTATWQTVSTVEDTQSLDGQFESLKQRTAGARHKLSVHRKNPLLPLIMEVRSL